MLLIILIVLVVAYIGYLWGKVLDEEKARKAELARERYYDPERAARRQERDYALGFGVVDELDKKAYDESREDDAKMAWDQALSAVKAERRGKA